MKKRRILSALLLALSVCAFLLCACNDNKPAENTREVAEDHSGEITPDENSEITTPQKEMVVLKLYFPDNEALYLYPEERSVELDAGESREEAVLDELFYGPKNEELSPSLSGEDLINSVYTDEDGLCTVDFNQDFVTLNTGGTTRESFAIASIVNSLCELDGVERVKINIDGNINAQFGHSMLESEYRAMPSLVAH